MAKAISDVDWTKVRNLTLLEELADLLVTRYEWFTSEMRDNVAQYVEEKIALELDITIPSFA